MSRKSTASELEAEEAEANIPLRRSARTTNGNGTPATAGVTTRRVSQAVDSGTPAKATRSRRGSAQSVEEKVESKPTTRSKRAEETSQKETTAPSARRGRKQSATSESSDKETENPKPVRGRRGSKADSEDDEKPQKTAPIRTRRGSASTDTEPEVKVAPASATSRRRGSATENVAVAEVSTPVKRSTRGRKASDTEQVEEEEVKKPAKRGRKKSEETIAAEEVVVVKPVTRRSRRLSAEEDVITTNTAPKRLTRRNSANLESSDDDVDVATTLREISVKVTPLKKRKLVEAELDLSIINESAGDIDRSKHEESLKETVQENDVTEEPKSLLTTTNEKSVNAQSSSDIDHTKHEESLIKETVQEKEAQSNTADSPTTNAEIVVKTIPRESPSAGSTEHSPLNRKRLIDNTVEAESSPRKSPRLIGKSSSGVEGESSARKSPRLIDKSPRSYTTQNELDSIEALIEVKDKALASAQQSSVSIEESAQHCKQEEELGNISTKSTGSNKENIDVTDPVARTAVKDIVEKFEEISVKVPTPTTTIIVARVSNVFKPNQREYSFMEPMDVDTSLIRPDDHSLMDKSVASDESCSVEFNRNPPKFGESAILQDSSSVFNKTLTSSIETDVEAKSIRNKDTSVKPTEDNFKPSETEGSDNNVQAEETEETVSFRLKPTKLDVKPSTSPPDSDEPSLILNSSALAKVKVVLSRKSSSPINVKQRSSRKSMSDNNMSTDSESESQGKLRVSRPRRRSKSKSLTPSPVKSAGDCLLDMPRKSKSPSPQRSKSKSKSPSSRDNLDNKQVEEERNRPHNKRRLSKSPTITMVEEETSADIHNNKGSLLGDTNEDNVTVFEQSFEKPRGSEEVLVANDKISSKEDLSEAQRVLEGEDHFKQPNTRNDEVQTTKHSDSTHYDFDLPSDDDDLLDYSNRRDKSGVNNPAEEGGECAENVSELRDEEKIDNKGEQKPQEGVDSENVAIIQASSSSVFSKPIEMSSKEDTDIIRVKPTEDKDTIKEEPQEETNELKADEEHSRELIIEGQATKTTHEKAQSLNTPKSEQLRTMELDDGDNVFENIVPPKQDNPPESVDSDLQCDESKEVAHSEENGVEMELSSKANSKNEWETVEEESTAVDDIGVRPRSKKAKSVDIKLAKRRVKHEKLAPAQSKRSMDDFAMTKLNEYLQSKFKEIEESSSEGDEASEKEESESEKEYNEFIDGMAEEGEEDTPSEDSNQIIDEGESVGSSDSECIELEEDYYEDDDSFICHDEDSGELLSGTEYDLGDEKQKPKKSRIIDPTTLGDEEIIKLPKKTTEKEVPKRRSRIIPASESSSEEEIIDKTETDVPKEKSKIILLPESSIEEKTIDERSEIVIEETFYDQTNDEPSSAVIEIEESKHVEDNNTNITIEDSIATVNESLNNKQPNQDLIVVDEAITTNDELISQNSLLSSLQQRHRRSSLTIQENIFIDDGKRDPTISQRINTLVESFCSTVKKGEIAINLSLEYEDSCEPSKEESNKTENVHILSNITICPANNLPADEQLQTEIVEPQKDEVFEPMPEQPEDLRNVLNERKLKRRLSKSLTEIYDEEKKAKRRKKNKKKTKKATSEEDLLSQEKASKKLKKKKLKLSNNLSEISEASSSFGLMNQLITDVKNRPKRVLRPTITDSEADSSWVETRVPNLKPSTSPAAKHERIKVPPKKFHPKDFKNQLLSDPRRVKQVDTKTLMKKKGAFF